MQTLACKQTLI